MNAGFGLLIVDPSWNIGLRLSEQYEARPTPSYRLGLGFALDDLILDVDQALLGSGYSGITPIADLATAYMTFWASGSGAYATDAETNGATLVQSGYGGIFAAQPARLKRIRVGSGLTMLSLPEAVEINVNFPSVQPPDLSLYVTWTAYNPFRQDVLDNAVFRRSDARRRLTLLSRDVQLVDQTGETILLVPEIFEILRGSPAAPNEPILANPLLRVTAARTSARAFSAEFLSYYARLLHTGLEASTTLQLQVAGSVVSTLTTAGWTAPAYTASGGGHTASLAPQWLDTSGPFQFSINGQTVATINEDGILTDAVQLQDQTVQAATLLGPTALATPHNFTFRRLSETSGAFQTLMSLKPGLVEALNLAWTGTLVTDTGEFRCRNVSILQDGTTSVIRTFPGPLEFQIKMLTNAATWPSAAR